MCDYVMYEEAEVYKLVAILTTNNCGPVAEAVTDHVKYSKAARIGKGCLRIHCIKSM